MNRSTPPLLASLFITATSLITPGLSAEAPPDLTKQLAKITFEPFVAAKDYSEGPSWLNGELFFCSGGLLRVDTHRKIHKFLGIGPAGTVVTSDGHLIVCDNKYKALLDVAPDGRVGVIVEEFEGRPLRSLNDLTIDARGNIYWTDPEGSTLENPGGEIFRVTPAGRVDLIATGLAFPNGLDIDPTGKRLYVIASRSRKILRYEVPPDNERLGKPEVFYDLGGTGGDGCVFDAQGNFWVADFHRTDTNQGRITVLSPGAKVLAHLPVPAKAVSNITFGGPKNDEIFCTTGDPSGVFHAAVGVPGFKGHPGKPMTITRYLNVVVRRSHDDADGLRKIAAMVEASSHNEGGTLNDAESKQLQMQIDALTDPKVRHDAQEMLPAFRAAAVHHRHEQELLAEVKRLHGHANSEVFAPDWLRAIVGDSSLGVFEHIVELDLNERTDGHKAAEAKPLSDRVTDDWLTRLSGETALRRLELSGTAVTSAGMIHLRNLTNLERLNICLTAVDDEGLKPLAALTKMRRLTICSSKITGSGFTDLQAMSQLISVNLHSSPANDAGLEAIGKMTSLHRLEIVHTHVTDAGLAHLDGLVNLRELHIASPAATEKGAAFLPALKSLEQLDLYEKLASDEAMQHAAKLPNLRILRLIVGPLTNDGVKRVGQISSLEELSVACGNITDAAVINLAGLKKLRKIDLHGTKITAAGREHLKALLPQVEIAQ